MTIFDSYYTEPEPNPHQTYVSPVCIGLFMVSCNYLPCSFELDAKSWEEAQSLGQAHTESMGDDN